MGAVGRKCFLAISGTQARSEQHRALGFHRKEPAPLGNAQNRLFYFHVYHLEADALIKPRTEPPYKATNSRRTTHSAAAPQSEKLLSFVVGSTFMFFCVFPVGKTSCGVPQLKRHKKGSEVEAGTPTRRQETGQGHAERIFERFLN